MARVPNTSVIPPEGHHFVDTSTGVPVRIDGTSAEDVAKKVLEHRLANRRPPGNPLQEVNDYVCNTWPHFCRETEPPVVPGISNARPHISLRVSTWLASFVRFASGDPGVHPSIAERRATICAACPKNVSYASGCGSCQDSIARLSFVYLRDRRTASDSRLAACDVTGQENRCGVWTEKLPPLTEDQQSVMPSNCWRR